MSEMPAEEIYQRLFERWGAQGWWPGQTEFEVIVGAILTQNTNWKNVRKALANLQTAGVLQARSLALLATEELAELIRPSGYYNVKAEYLKSFLKMLQDDFKGSLKRLFSLSTPALRKKLLAVRGIGPETADSILLYAAERPVFVVDAYTRRMLVRHGWCSKKLAYDALAQLFTSRLPRNRDLFNEFHALIVKLGKEYCHTQPRCEGCPLASWQKYLD